jgi:hypothetical protein
MHVLRLPVCVLLLFSHVFFMFLSCFFRVFVVFFFFFLRYAHELTRYGVPVGHNNFAAAYCTGLLCARRLLAKYGLADKYAGNGEVSGEVYHVEALEDEGEPRPFRACVVVQGLFFLFFLFFFFFG